MLSLNFEDQNAFIKWTIMKTIYIWKWIYVNKRKIKLWATEKISKLRKATSNAVKTNSKIFPITEKNYCWAKLTIYTFFYILPISFSLFYLCTLGWPMCFKCFYFLIETTDPLHAPPFSHSKIWALN